VTTEAALRAQLTKLLHVTAGAAGLMPAAAWRGDKAGERRVRDDLASGRVSFRNAHQSAQRGLAALDRDELDLARAALDNGLWLLIDALMTRVRPEDRKTLGRPAKRRGRPQKKSKN
jgi:hypothetical protein